MSLPTLIIHAEAKNEAIECTRLCHATQHGDMLPRIGPGDFGVKRLPWNSP